VFVDYEVLIARPRVVWEPLVCVVCLPECAVYVFARLATAL